MPRRVLKSQPSDFRSIDGDKVHSFSQSLEPIYDLNRRMLALLSEPGNAEHPDFHAGAPVGLALLDVGPSALQQLAQCPFLLLDAGFDTAGYWRLEEGPEIIADQQAIKQTGVRVLALARATCLLGWYLVRTNPVAARLLLGASSESARQIALCGLTDVQEIAIRLVAHRHFLPRWHNRPEVWRRLVDLAKRTSGIRVGVHGLQLLLGDLVATDDS
jgi:hypothetical protein